jgi:predicted O-methyltransferase YrrM
MRSSYKQNEYGKLFEALAAIHKPKIIVECGVLDGYSLISLARGCPTANVYGIDLFEDYEFNHGDQETILTEFWDEGLAPGLDLIKKDAIEAADIFDDESVGILHIDISNDGENLKAMFKAWWNKVEKNGLIIFEGGSEERDEVEWMVKYDKIPIAKAKESLAFDVYENGILEYVTLTPFPSLTIVRKVL